MSNVSMCSQSFTDVLSLNNILIYRNHRVRSSFRPFLGLNFDFAANPSYPMLFMRSKKQDINW